MDSNKHLPTETYYELIGDTKTLSLSSILEVCNTVGENVIDCLNEECLLDYFMRQLNTTQKLLLLSHAGAMEVVMTNLNSLPNNVLEDIANEFKPVFDIAVAVNKLKDELYPDKGFNEVPPAYLFAFAVLCTVFRAEYIIGERVSNGDVVQK